MKFDPSIPKYYQLKERLKRQILNGDYKMGEQLATERDLMRQSGLSLLTVRQALSELVKDGLVFRIQGKGTFVGKNTVEAEKKSSSLIGLVISEELDPLYPPYAYDILNLAKECNRQFLDMRIFTCPVAGMSGGHCHLRETVDSENVSGLLFRCLPSGKDIEYLERKNIPFVLVGWNLPDGKVYSVTVDVQAGVIAAMKHLFELGHQRIGLLGGPGTHTSAQLKLGYRAALKKQGMAVEEALIVDTPWGLEGGKAGAERLLGLKKTPTAILAGEEIMAVGVMRKALQMGLKVPGDLSIVGYSDRLDAALYPVPLTTVDTNLAEQNRLAVEMLVDRMAGRKSGTKLKVQPRLIVRESTGAVVEETVVASA